MRSLLASLLVAALAAAAAAQSREGVYRSAGAPDAPWRINEHHTLLWRGEAYLPIGLRLQGTPSAIAEARAAGVQDLLLELPASGAGWQAAFEAAEAGQARYALCVNSLAPGAHGTVIEPQGYRVSGITEARKVRLKLPGAVRALTVLATERDMAVEHTKLLSVVDGVLEIDVEPRNTLEHVLLIYPEMASLDLPDFWEGFDRHRDLLVDSLARTPPGPGLRAIVNPLGATVRLATREAATVPLSPYFRDEFQAHLETRYRNVETLQRAWSMSATAIDSFPVMARLVPLWNGGRGVSLLWDPQTNQTFPCNSRNSTIWTDLQTVIGSIAARRYDRLASAIRRMCDVPIVQEWSGWAAPYETTRPSVDGLGMRVDATSPAAIARAGSPATSSLLRWSTPGWLAATDIDLKSAMDPPAALGAVVDDLASLGARGWFVRPGGRALGQAVAELARLRGNDASYAQWSPIPVFFPENATNPAVPQRLPNGRYWLPSPASGNRIDLGSEFFGYRYQDGTQSFIALWTSRGAARVKLRMLDPKAASFASADGSDPQPRVQRNGVEVTVGDVPLIITGTSEIPVPEPSYSETIMQFDQLLAYAETVGRDATEERFLFRDALNGYERNPSGSFPILRQQVSKLNLKLARFSWIEAEASRIHTFSETRQIPGCSGGGVLALDTPLAAGPEGYFAEYTVQVRNSDEMVVWVAATLSPESRSALRVTIGGQSLSVAGETFGTYASGYGWYRLGTTRLAGGSQKVRLVVDAPEGANLAVDAILLAPDGVTPSGVRQPDAIPFQKPPP